MNWGWPHRFFTDALFLAAAEKLVPGAAIRRVPDGRDQLESWPPSGLRLTFWPHPFAATRGTDAIRRPRSRSWNSVVAACHDHSTRHFRNGPRYFVSVARGLF